MDVHQLRMFVAAAEEGSLRCAARKVYIAQPQLSQIIRRLEREVGAALLVRSSKGVELTPAGLVLLDKARIIIRDLEQTIELVREAAEADRTITIGLLGGQLAAGELTEPILSAFRDANPTSSIKVRELTFASQFSALDDGEVDVALVRPPASDDRLEIRPLLDDRRVLCVGRDHRMAEATTLDAEAVVNETMVDLAGPRRWTDFWLLNDVRGGSGRTCARPIETVDELKFTLMYDKVVMPVAHSTWRMALADPNLRAVPLTGVEPSTIAVASRRGERRRDVIAFADCADVICRRLGDQIRRAPIPVSA